MKYIALLRGINLGSKRIKMADLIKSLESMDVKNVKTYLQSGNVIFDHNSSNITEIRENIEKKIGQTFGFSVNVIIRTENELKDIINSNSFIKEDEVEIDKLHVTFLQDMPDKKAVLDLDISKDKNEKFEVNDREIYLYLPNGYAKTKLTNNMFEKKLKTIATTRNWKTTNKLLDLIKLE